jgi:hypothetical protein
VPARFDQVLDLVHRSSDRFDCQPGDLVVMVAGVVHHSPPNCSTETRVAAHAVITPSGGPLLFFYADELTEPDKVEVYEVDIDQYVRLIRDGNPRSVVPLAGLMDREPTEMTPVRFQAGLAARSGPGEITCR